MKKIIMILMAVLVLSGCDDSDKKAQQQRIDQQRYAEQQERNEYNQQNQQPQVVYAQQPSQAPVIINQQPSNSGMSDALVAGAAGYMIGSALNGNNSRSYNDRGYNDRNYNSRTSNKSYKSTTVVNNYHPAPVQQPRPAKYYGSTSSSSYSKPSTQKRSVYSKVFKSSSKKRR